MKNEILMHRERYSIYKDHPDAMIRRKVTCELDRFLMENRETIINMLAEQTQPRRRWRRKA